MAETPRAPAGSKRCPACGSRMTADVSVCETCGHQFGLTGAIPLAEIEKARERELERLAAARSSAGRPRRATRAAAAAGGPRRIPWGVISVVLLTIALLGGGYWLLQRAAVVAPGEPTATPAIFGVVASATPAFVLEELAPPTAPPTAYVLPTRTPVPLKKYTVVSGDTCGGIAKALGVPFSEFLRVNQLNDAACSRLQIGDELIIPAPTPTPGPTETLSPDYTPPPQPTTEGGTYVVKQGDSCSAIAAQFNISVDDLIQLNSNLNLNQQCLIQVGDKLNVSTANVATAPVATPYLLLAPTARESYPPPQLLSPVDDGRISDTLVLLEWLSVGLLQPNEVYVVQIQPAGAITVPLYETRSTSLRVSSELLGDQPERAIAWWVQVRRRIGEQNGMPIYREAGLPSPARRFIWRRPNTLAAATPTP